MYLRKLLHEFPQTSFYYSFIGAFYLKSLTGNVSVVLNSYDLNGV
ncbi:hypothetical protein SAMN05216283_107175 [Sunxiuqinia elliptica]|uniref:Uncharacterized protein n=1 Tax=Sunxiuqinia elliptica TaxID=655355 RepID=A0A1I2J308_9BACT|nr:hypothetical protein SAMN05216283_107175 [Sunxiuqinia elliptica]